MITKRTAKAIIRRVADAIEAEAESLELSRWGTAVDGNRTALTGDLAAPKCGTPACLAGHIAWQGRRSSAQDDIGASAQEVLIAIGIEHEDYMSLGYNLFALDCDKWPKSYQPDGDVYYATASEIAAAAVRMLRDIADGKHDAFAKVDT